MRVMVIVKATKDSEAGVLPNPELLAAMGAYNEELIKAGIMKSGDGLKPSSKGYRVHFSGANRVVTDGPFAETKELIAGYWLWEVNSIEEAIEWVKRCPNPMTEDSDIEIRPLYEMADFAEVDPSGQVQEMESEQLKRITEMSEDEAEIRRLISAWSRALEAKDVDRLLANYAEDVVLFDAIPPYQTVGIENLRKVWLGCLPYFPDTFRSEHRDIVVNVRGDTAFVRCLHHLIPTPADHPSGSTWMRVTTGLSRMNGAWKVVHEHVSIPFNPMTNEAWLIQDPDTLSVPDYSC